MKKLYLGILLVVVLAVAVALVGPDLDAATQEAFQQQGTPIASVRFETLLTDPRDGSVWDGPAAYHWSKLSGPSLRIFDTFSDSTVIEFMELGDYEMEVKVFDNGNGNKEPVFIRGTVHIVADPNAPPTPTPEPEPEDFWPPDVQVIPGFDITITEGNFVEP